MRAILLLTILVLFSSCSARDYHLGMLNESTVNSRQAYHINQIKKYDRQRLANSNNRICYTYPPALGSFTSGCYDRLSSY